VDDLAFPPEPLPGDEHPPSIDDLNEPQREAAAHVDGPLLVFAGAGSGKTRVITYRIANLVAVRRVAPYRVLAVTFTNKAAGEMKRRLEGLIGPDMTRDLWVGTFHATCARLLRKHHAAAGLERAFVIYDDADQRAVMTRVMKELDIDDRRYPVRQLLSRVHREKQEGRGPEDFRPESYVDDVVAKCFEGYQRRLREASAVDFEDLLLSVLRLVEDPESLAGEELRRRFSHVLVDEFQDSNQVQYRLVRGFVSHTRNLCVVGDDDQSIYRWRGADVRIIRNFRRDFPDAKIVKLEQNYRSSGHIVRAALSVIRSAKDREPKELWTARKDGEPIHLSAALSERDEAAWVAEGIKAALGKGVPASEVAVFYRVHAQSRVLEEVLRAENIPYQVIGGTRFFERAEVKDLLSYLRVIANPRSDVDLLRIINVPARKIGAATIERLTTMADGRGSSLYDAIEPLVKSDSIGGAAKKSLLVFRDLLEDLRKDAGSASPQEIAEDVLEKSGYTRLLEADDSAESDARLQNLRELVGSIAEYEEEAAAEGEVGTLAGYLERVTLASDVDSMEDVPKVAMMTVHGAKGLEFHTVFLTGMEEEMFPFRGLDPKHAEELEEERRLAYVALTRARDRLFVSYAQTRMIFGTTRYGIPSRFLADLPQASIRAVATSTRSFFGAPRREGAGAFAQRPREPWVHPQERAAPAPPRRAPEAPARAPGERYVERDTQHEAQADAGALRQGARVTHERYGDGVILRVDPGDDPTATVKFRGWGEKRIKARFLHGAP
jgi:DNA helicase-2/ATP-dependent DNA helicase PcrA